MHTHTHLHTYTHIHKEKNDEKWKNCLHWSDQILSKDGCSWTTHNWPPLHFFLVCLPLGERAGGGNFSFLCFSLSCLNQLSASLLTSMGWNGGRRRSAADWSFVQTDRIPALAGWGCCRALDGKFQWLGFSSNPAFGALLVVSAVGRLDQHPTRGGRMLIAAGHLDLRGFLRILLVSGEAHPPQACALHHPWTWPSQAQSLSVITCLFCFLSLFRWSLKGKASDSPLHLSAGIPLGTDFSVSAWVTFC